MEINFVMLANQVLRSIRGKRTREALAIKIGESPQKIYKWESGNRKIFWGDFVKFCHGCDADLKEAVRGAFHYSGSLDETAELSKI